MDKIKEQLEAIVVDYENRIVRFCEDTNRVSEETSAFHLGLDGDDVPHSYGNFDDCYQDGFDNGELEGEYMLAQKLLSMME